MDFPRGDEEGDEEDVDDSELLRRFLEGLKSFLESLMTDKYSRLFEEELRPPMIEAWPETTEHFPVAIEQVRQLPPRLMHLHGLTGNSLRYKLKLIWLRLRRFLGSVSGPLLAALIDAIDIVLESILTAIGAASVVEGGAGVVVGSAIKEFKDAVRQSIKIDEAT